MTNLPTTGDAEKDERYLVRRADRFALLEARYRITKVKRFRGCKRWLNGDAAGLVTVRKSQDGRAHYSGLQTCGSVWACPVCAAKIRQARADELEHAISLWLAAGHGVEFATFTLEHHQGDRLADTFQAVADGWKKGVLQGRHLRGLRMSGSILGFCKVIEVTYGANGWHPHAHALFFTDRPWSAEERAAAGAGLFRSWSNFVRNSTGRECSPDAFKIVGGSAGAGAYLVKVQDEHDRERRLGMEMTRGDLKIGRGVSLTPFELLPAAADGEAKALRLWWEWESVTRGRRMLSWSVGCRKMLALGQEADDQELADAEVDGQVVLEVAGLTWARLIQVPGARAGLLDAVERGEGAGDGWLYLRTLSQRASSPPGSGSRRTLLAG